MRLENKVAIITGAASGIGLAAAKRFVEEGAKVMMSDVNSGALESAAGEVGPDAVDWMAADVSQEDQVRDLVESTVKKFGKLDIFVANAGIEGKVAEIADSTVEDFDQVMAVNVRGVWLGLKYAMKTLRESGGGSIVITSSGAGVQGQANLAPYNASKHAVVGLMRCAALEGARYGIRVNTVNPGAVETRMMRSLEEGYAPGGGEAFKDTINAATPLGRYARPDEIANMTLFLASDEASYCTGGIYMVDGGLTA